MTFQKGAIVLLVRCDSSILLRRQRTSLRSFSDETGLPLGRRSFVDIHSTQIKQERRTGGKKGRSDLGRSLLPRKFSERSRQERMDGNKKGRVDRV